MNINRSPDPWWTNAVDQLAAVSVYSDPAPAAAPHAPAPDLAALLAAKVFDRIETDRTLIKQNMEAEIRQALMLQGAPAEHGEAVQTLVNAASEALKEITAHVRVRDMPNCFVKSMEALDKALARVGR